jgi:hypothetical protein
MDNQWPNTTQPMNVNLKEAILQPHIETIWQATSEPKCRFLAWLAVHDKVLTANNMLKENDPCEYNLSLRS